MRVMSICEALRVVEAGGSAYLLLPKVSIKFNSRQTVVCPTPVCCLATLRLRLAHDWHPLIVSLMFMLCLRYLVYLAPDEHCRFSFPVPDGMMVS